MVGGGKDREEMRLIDADALITKARQIDFLKLPNSTKISAGEIIAIINKRPTAFDTEKVIEQLDEKIEIAWGDDYKEGREDAFNEAIDIVKKGGVE